MYAALFAFVKPSQNFLPKGFATYTAKQRYHVTMQQVIKQGDPLILVCPGLSWF